MNAPVSVQQLLPELDQTHLDWLEEEADIARRRHRRHRRDARAMIDPERGYE